MHENTLLNVFNSTIDRLDKKIDILKEENSKLKKELTDLRERVQYHSDNVDEVNKKLEDIGSRVEEINQTRRNCWRFCHKNKEETNWFRRLQSSKQSTFSWVLRRNNNRKHNNRFCERKVRIEEKILIERAHRTGKIQRNDGTWKRKRTIVVNFLNFKDKSRILHTYREKKLWKENVFVNGDF